MPMLYQHHNLGMGDGACDLPDFNTEGQIVWLMDIQLLQILRWGSVSVFQIADVMLNNLIEECIESIKNMSLLKECNKLENGWILK